jgi:hypothetical protein
VPYVLQAGDVVFVEPRGRGLMGASGAVLGMLYGVGLVILGAALSN